MSGLELPRFGMGTAGIGNLYAAVSDAEADAAIRTAWEGGIRYFDTAPFYGFGLAESRLGAVLSRIDPDESAIISTKVGRLLDPVEAPARERYCYVDAAPFEPRFDYGRDAVLRSHEESLVRLHRNRVNILLAHDIGRLTHGTASDAHLRDFLDSGYPAMMELRAAGAIDAVGLGVNEVEISEFLLERIELDFILLAGRLTLLDQSALDRVVPLCREKGVKLIAGGPYNSGILARPTSEQTNPHFDYDTPAAAIVQRAREIEKVCERFGVPLPVAALHFPHREPAVASVIPGISGAGEAAEGLDRIHQGVPEGLWKALSAEGLVRTDGRPGDGTAKRPPRLILLHDSDTILVCVTPIAPGDEIEIDGTSWVADQQVDVGHKVARRPLVSGDRVIKYGAPIGSITVATPAGGWVHVHNMKSDYIASHSRETLSEENG